jgi:hypothetical protein
MTVRESEPSGYWIARLKRAMTLSWSTYSRTDAYDAAAERGRSLS